MSPSAEASQLLRRVVEPVSAGESIKALIRRASMRTGLSFSRVKSLWYAEARVIRAEEIDLLRMKALRAAKAVGERENAGRAEYQELNERLERIEALVRDLAHSPRASASGPGDQGGPGA